MRPTHLLQPRTGTPSSHTPAKEVAAASPGARTRTRPGVMTRMARRLVFRTLSRIRRGHIMVEEADGRQTGFGDSGSPLTTHLTISDPAMYRAVAFGGSIGSAESYMDGHWSCSDLVALVRIMVLNMDVLSAMDLRNAALRGLVERLGNLARRNNRSGARRNIAAHYDLSNDFFATFLDPTMMYSSAIFKDASQSLDEAAVAKLRHISERLDLGPDDHLLEIGTGWGGMAELAAREYGCRVTTTTLSREQYQFTLERIHEAGLEDRVTVLMEDYRDLQGQYDKLVSIEMIEAVGHEYYRDYFEKCASLLKPDGLMLIQAITISDQRYDRARRKVDFIQRYIFPGGCLPSNSVIASHVARFTDMQIVGMEDITQDYALTLAHWRQRFLHQSRRITDTGFSEPFLRMWDYYLAYCQGGFMERVIHTAQFLIARPEARLAPLHARLASRERNS
ncbi:MAG: cyclopropane-fatty-acyl-phospholipid synthase family protein [Pseudohongiellaceae bacterium]